METEAKPKAQAEQFPLVLTPVRGEKEATVRRSAILAIVAAIAFTALAGWFVSLVIAEKDHPAPDSPMATDPYFMIAVTFIVLTLMLVLVGSMVYVLMVRPWIFWKQEWVERELSNIATKAYLLTGANLELVYELLAAAAEDSAIGVEWHESLSHEGTVRFPAPVVVRDGPVIRLAAGSRAIVRRRGSAAAQAALLPDLPRVEMAG